MSNRLYTIPNGKNTENPNEYLDEWQKINSAIERILDCQVIGFDPNLVINSKEGKSFTLPLWAARKIIESNQLSQPADVGIIIRMNSEYNKVYRDTRNGGKAMRAAIDEWIAAKAEGDE